MQLLVDVVVPACTEVTVVEFDELVFPAVEPMVLIGVKILFFNNN